MPAPQRKIIGSSFPILQPGNLPVVRAGAWHSIPPFGPAGTMSTTVDRLYALALWPGRRCALTSVAVNVTVAAAGASLRVGLYTSGNGLPLTLVADFGAMGLGALGVAIFPAFATPLEPELYFLAFVRQGGALVSLSTRDTWSPIISELTPTLTGDLNAYYTEPVAGALPELFGLPTGSIQGPSASVQLT